MIGLPADTGSGHHKYTKRAAAPHPFWNEVPFTFKRVREGGRSGDEWMDGWLVKRRGEGEGREGQAQKGIVDA